jgi:hypothetical protein
MESRLKDLILGRGANYILPFLWMHGEEEDILRGEIQKIHECGIGAFCVESRPHPDFCGELWWRDMDIVLDEAKKHAMRVWILDDAHFPTGFANGALKTAPDEKHKQYLNVNHVDVSGPMPRVGIAVGDMAKYSPPIGELIQRASGKAPPPGRVFTDDFLVGVTALRLGGAAGAEEVPLDLTAQVKDGALLWDVPEGAWRVFVFYVTRNGGAKPDYINIIDRPSCRLQIDAVYEPHYARYAADFGKTIAGFFSDEPEFGNTGWYNFDESIGRKKMPLPWNADMPLLMESAAGGDWVRRLHALWYETGDAALSARTRYAYMDSVTRLVRENFSRQLGAWCEDHGVEYIGHIIEDNNQHSRLGCGLGHFFRAMDGQHMAGIDDIGSQVLPGGEGYVREGFTSMDGEFCHYALGKLGSSLGHIDPKKQGRAMCEIFGAYGWNEGTRLMKYLTDHFLVRGINRFVPHAFSPKEFPDPDCPPHFYARGNNPLFRHFGKLMAYMNRLCHLLSGGVHIAPAALLYHGEAEWTGGAMYLQKPARVLLDNQIDFDILPQDVFAEAGAARLRDGRLEVNQESYRVLIVPYAEFITRAAADFIRQSLEQNFPVVFINALPSGLCDSPLPLPDLGQCRVIPLEKLADYLRTERLFDVRLDTPFPLLRYYRYRHEKETFFFSNEHTGKTFDGEIYVPLQGDAVLYDAMENELRPAALRAVEGGSYLRLSLAPYESAILSFDSALDAGPEKIKAPQKTGGRRIPVRGPWNFSIAAALEYPRFHDRRELAELVNMGEILPAFSGFMRYETKLVLEKPAGAVLTIEHAFEGVELWVNGQYGGMKICPPYRFTIGELVRDGENVLRIEVATTPSRAARAAKGGGLFELQGVSPQEPTGMFGEISIAVP